MALIKCPECGKEVSDKASSCPNCGCPLEKNKTVDAIDDSKGKKSKKKKSKKKTTKKLLISIGIVIVLSFIGIVIYYIATINERTYKSAKVLFNANQYEEAYAAFSEIEDYKDSMEMAKECLYLKGKELFTSEEYQRALDCFKQLESYKDSADMMSQCNYYLSVDGQFIKSLSKGLMTRWDVSGQDGVEDMSDTEYANHLRECVNSELSLLQKFKEETFHDSSLQQKAIEYIEILEKSLSAIDYYSMNYDKYSSIWDEVYAARTKLLRDFFNDYNLVVDEAYEDTKNEFLINATVVEENEALEASIVDMMNRFTIDKIIEDYGGVTATVTMVNTTDKTFKYFGCDMEFLDENDTIIYTSYTGEVQNFQPGQKASLEVYCGENDFESVIYHANYYVQE